MTETEYRELAIGDQVVIATDGGYYGWGEGDICEVAVVEQYGERVLIYFRKANETLYFSATEISHKVPKQTDPEEPKEATEEYKVGDRVTMVSHEVTTTHVPLGTQGTVTQIDPGCAQKMPLFITFDTDNHLWCKLSQVQKVVATPDLTRNQVLISAYEEILRNTEGTLQDLRKIERITKEITTLATQLETLTGKVYADPINPTGTNATEK